MSKIKLLLDVVEDMRSLADSLQSLATVFRETQQHRRKRPHNRLTIRRQSPPRLRSPSIRCAPCWLKRAARARRKPSKR